LPEKNKIRHFSDFNGLNRLNRLNGHTLNMEKKKIKVAVGLSGGVDSSVAAAL
jgi:tRNA(Ile)-lysidine synthase TilS/MesJ